MKHFFKIFIIFILIGCNGIDPKVTKDTGLYELPDTTSKIIYELNKGDDVDYTFRIYNWCRVKYLEYTGYMLCEDLDIDDIQNDPSLPLYGKNIIVDAGHGGKDNGAIVDGINEKDINRAVTDYLIEDLRKAGANVIETRKNDETLYLYDRPTLTNLVIAIENYLNTNNPDMKRRLGELIIDLEASLSANKDIPDDLYQKGDDMNVDLQTFFELANIIDNTLFVSIHSNVTGNENIKLQGLDILLSGNNLADKYPGYNRFNEEERIALGNLLGDIISKETGMPLNKVYFGDYAVLREHNLPSALIELGYMDNEEDLKFLLDETNQKNYAKAITDAIIAYFNQKDDAYI